MDWLGASAVSGIWVNRNKNSFENTEENRSKFSGIVIFWSALWTSLPSEFQDISFSSILTDLESSSSFKSLFCILYPLWS